MEKDNLDACAERSDKAMQPGAFASGACGVHAWDMSVEAYNRWLLVSKGRQPLGTLVECLRQEMFADV